MASTPPSSDLVLLPPNRVWRTYQGGRTLDALSACATPADTHFPEDWIASTTRAVNTGRDTIAEGVSEVISGARRLPFTTLLAENPAYYLGPTHLARHGPDPRLLVKFIDSAIRLHFQVHPTAAFARQFLGSPSGKTEAYHVLSTRPDQADPHIFLGFQRPPTRDTLRHLIATQDIAGLQACFDPIPVRPGDTFIVPGGVPHALGAGVFLVELQEPTDLVVRCEFERGGYVLPESARFMNRGLDFCLDIFDLTPRPLALIDDTLYCPPHHPTQLGARSRHEHLIGPAQTACFGLSRLHLHEPLTFPHHAFYLGIVTAGAVTIETDVATHHLRRYDKFFVPAGLPPPHLSPAPFAEILLCHPPGGDR